MAIALKTETTQTVKTINRLTITGAEVEKLAKALSKGYLTAQLNCESKDSVSIIWEDAS